MTVEEEQFRNGLALGRMYSMPAHTLIGIWYGMYIGMIEKTWKHFGYN